MNNFAAERVCNSNGEQEDEVRRGPWTLEEDSQLIHYIARHGEGHWNMLAKLAGLKRTGKSCRLRWLNYLKPDIKRGNLTPKEQLLILELHSKFGNRWSKMAQHLPGRTDNEIKNYWRTRVQKQARQLNIDSGSKTFLDAVRCFWMPRLLQKMEQNSSAASSSSSVLTLNSDGGPADISMLKSSMAPPVVPTPIATVDMMHHNENQSRDASSNLNIWQQLPEISEWPRIPSASHDAIDISNTDICNNSIDDSYFLDSDNYHDTIEVNYSNPMSSLENNNIPQFGCHVEENDWVFDNMGEALWKMDAI